MLVYYNYDIDVCFCVCFLRLASESVQSVLPSPWQGQSLCDRGQAWGCVSLSDILLLLEVKYDVVTHLLYTEMLQEHYCKEQFLNNLLIKLTQHHSAWSRCFKLLFFPLSSLLGDTTALSIWETLLPWQQHKEEEGLGDLAEEALESGDMLRLAELPGAFRIYR